MPNKFLRTFIVAIVALMACGAAVAQQPSEAVIKLSRTGFDYERNKEYRLALYEYDSAIKLAPKYPYPYGRIGAIYYSLKNYALAIRYYTTAIKLDSNFDVYNYFNLGTPYRILGKHDSAVIALHEFLKRIQPITHEDTVRMKDADWWIKFNLGCIAEKAKPKNTEEPVALSEINSKFDDFAPSVTADGLTLYFTSTRPGTNTQQIIESDLLDYGEDLWKTVRDTAGHWSKPAPLPPPINSTDDEGSATISADGQSMYISLARRADGNGESDIYKSDLVGDQWTNPMNMGRPINSQAWDAQPSLTADGITMYFSSRRSDAMDSSEDLYVTHKNTDGSWTPPHNLGEPVNTRFNESSPFISADGRTLYFSSNGHPGFGNKDLFMSRLLDDGTWSIPVNLGQPINAYGDDEFLTIPARGDKVIYSTQRADARGPMNLYEAKLPAEFRPGPVTVVAGTVYDKVTHAPLGARIEVNDLKSDQLVAVYHSNKVTGKFYIALGTGKIYGITALADGYVHFSDSVHVPDTISYREVTHDLPLTPLPPTIAQTTPGQKQPPTKQPTTKQPPTKQPKTPKQPKTTPAIDSSNLGPAIELKNIFFDFNKAELRPESRTELRYFVDLLKSHPQYHIQIEGHTDSVGTVAYNQKLSETRANAVKQYLITQGIAAKRLTSKGFGSTRPLDTNATEEGRQKNRRTEFRFVKQS
jgi:outer membrane protein OmpA-like peptidoglycan-associated protein